MNLLIFSHSSALAGAERSLFELAKIFLCEYDAHVTVILPSNGPLEDMLRKEGATTIIAPIYWWCFPHKEFDEKTIKKRYAESFGWILDNASVLEKFHPDVVMTNSLVIPWGAIAAHFMKRPHIWMVNEFGEMDHNLKFLLDFKEVLLFIEQSSDKIITCSRAIQKTLFPNVESEQIDTIYYHIDVPGEQNNADATCVNPFLLPDARHLLISGNIIQSKGQEDAVRAAIELAKQRQREIELVIAGYDEPDFKRYLREIIDSENADDYIHILPFQQNIFPLIHHADIVLVCSRMEGFGRVTLEAMLMDKAIVATNTGGTLEMISHGETGFLYTPGNFIELADRIEMLLDDEDLRRNMGRNAKKYAQSTFTKKEYIDRYFSIINDLKNRKYREKDFMDSFVKDQWEILFYALKNQLAERNVHFENPCADFKEKEHQIIRMNRVAEERRAQLQMLEKDNLIRRQQVEDLSRKLNDTRILIERITSGNSWKVTKLFREARRWLTTPVVQLKRYFGMIRTGRLATAARFAGLVSSHPGKVLMLMRPHMLKKALGFLADNSWNFKKLIERGEGLYFRSEQKDRRKKIEAVCHPLIALYGLPKSSEDEFPAQPADDEVKSWVKALMKLTGSLLRESSAPKVSIVMPVHNQIRFTLACLHSIFFQKTKYAYEIIIADDCSGDRTFDVFKNQFSGVRYFRNLKNLGFLRNCNSAAKCATGEYLIFLNNDTLVCPGWLDELVSTLEENHSVGLAGSKLIYPQGNLQEAGGIIFYDGGGWNYGRFEDAALPQFNYMRDVDYCSGASLAISKKLWMQLGGFDEQFAPAYYEDTDLAFRVREAGYRVVYQPLSEVVHFEGISNGRSEFSGIKKHQLSNKKKFYSKWRQVLQSYGKCNPESLPADRAAKGRVLVIDATTPTPDKDSGSMDAFNYMAIMRELGFHITFIPENAVYFDDYTRDLQRKGIECSHLPWINSPKKAVEFYAPKADIIMLCRVNVAAPLVDLVKRKAPRARILFDTVDLHFLREERQAELTGSASLSARAKKTRERELDVIDKADATILRSSHEMELLKKLRPEARFFHFPIARDIPGLSEAAWEDRRDVVFIGGFAHPPNTDAIKYFVGDVWPILRRAGFSHRFIIVGSNVPDEIKALETDDIIVRGFVENLSDVFAHCLLSVAPLRYGAGMKGKVVTSLSYGVPCVATKIAAEGSGLVHRENILVAEDADEMVKMIQDICSNQRLWEKISQSGLAYCENAFSLEAAKKIIDEAFSEILNINQ
jgi:glycosyltransferase involved in cell wall biosynthesis